MNDINEEVEEEIDIIEIGGNNNEYM